MISTAIVAPVRNQQNDVEKLSYWNQMEAQELNSGWTFIAQKCQSGMLAYNYVDQSLL